MFEKAYAQMDPEERAGIRYIELTLADLRAFIIAHSIRKGQKPQVGANLGFALTLSETEVEDPARITPAEIDAARPLGARVWLGFTVTAADHAAAIELINSQRAKFFNGHTQSLTDQAFLDRLGTFLEAATRTL